MDQIRNHIEYDRQITDCACESIDWAKLEGKTILVSGATGMVGTFFIDVMMKRNQVGKDKIHIIAVGRNERKARLRLGSHWENSCFSFLCQDVCRDMGNVSCDFIVHGASNTHPLQYAADPVGTIQANVIGTGNLLELASAKEGCRLVFLSSVEVYGENRGDQDAFDEGYCGYLDCNTLRAGYPESKRLGEAMLQAYIAQKGADAVSVRLSRTYGPTMQKGDSKAIAQFIKKAVTKQDIVLKSDGTQIYSYVYVADAVRAIIKVMLDGESGQVYNVSGRDSDISLKELAGILAEEAGTALVFELPEEAERRGYSTATKAILNTDKLCQLGWESRWDIRTGLKSTLRILGMQRIVAKL